jgi:phage terminase large subunit GpA-like protein
MDSLSEFSSYVKVIVIKGAQLGLTEAGNNWLGYIMDNVPAPTLLVMPTDDAIKKNSKTRIDTMIESTPNLKEKVRVLKSRSGENTINQKNFPGGVLFMVGANSPVGLSSTPIKNVFMDEVDRYPLSVESEGSPIDLAIARTRTFAKKKIFIISTPTVYGFSAIENEFLQTDQNVYEVPCPHCGAYQELIFGQLVWEKKKYEGAQYQCVQCGQLIEERFKTVMLENGNWVPRCQENISARAIGFKLPSFYSPYGWMSWGDIAQQYDNAIKDPNKMKVFVNTVLGETWAEDTESPQWENLYNRREHYRLNRPCKAVCFITVGVDVQKDRLELEVVGWGSDKQSWSLDYRVLPGSTTLPEVWKELDKVVQETWVREDDIELGVKLMAVDSGAYTSEVYAWVRKYSSNKVIPIKGRAQLGIAVQPPVAIEYNSRGKKIKNVKLWKIGVSYLKTELYSWLGIEKGESEAPPCYCHFPEYAEHYFKGITSEDWIPSKRKWEKRFERNEPLDCRVYARAAAVIVGLDRLKQHQIEALSGNAKATRKTPSSNTEQKKRYKPDQSIWE